MKRHTLLYLVFVSSLCSLCLCGEAFSAEPEAKTSYKLRVVLGFAKSPQLTDVFCDRVERELRDGLQASFGDLVGVEVTRTHDRLRDVKDGGLKALDAWKERSEYKTHFVLIDFDGSDFVIQARQHDGTTGLAAVKPDGSALVRRDSTRDREFVARAAALLVEQDFGLVGSFAAWPKNATPNEDQPVEVQLKGGGLGVPLGRWVKKGDVFAVFQAPAGDKAPAARVEWAVLVVKQPPAEDGTGCVCRVFRRYTAPRGGGFLCVLLGAVEAPVRLRLLQNLGANNVGPLREALSVQVRRDGFGGDAGGKGPGDEPGQFQTTVSDALPDLDTSGKKEPTYDRVAFVNVLGPGNVVIARIPLALLDDKPVVLPVTIDTPEKADLVSRKADWDRAVSTAWLVHKELFDEINALTADPKRRADAMKRIDDALKRTDADCKRLNDEKEELIQAAAKAKAPKPNTGDADRLLAKLLEDKNELSKYRDRLKKIDDEENDPERKKWLTQIEEGQRLEKQLEMDKALALYDQVPKEYRPKGLDDHVAELKKAWETKDEDLKKARAFIYAVWPIQDDAGLKAKLGEAQAAFKKCKAAGDKVSLQKLFKATEAHTLRMADELRELKPKINIDDEAQARLIEEVNKELTRLATDINAALDQPGGK
jgi:hypothetical protein